MLSVSFYLLPSVALWPAFFRSSVHTYDLYIALCPSVCAFLCSVSLWPAHCLPVSPMSLLPLCHFTVCHVGLHSVVVPLLDSALFPSLCLNLCLLSVLLPFTLFLPLVLFLISRLILRPARCLCIPLWLPSVITAHSFSVLKCACLYCPSS